jgi:transcriptional regulator with XRE-family HTH domain
VKDQRLVDFGKRVREIRKDKGLSQEAFADLAGVDRSYMGQIERGEQNLSLIKIYKIAEVLDVEIHKLFPSKNRS